MKPHPRQAADIDALFKEHVDLRSILLDLKRTLGDPIRILKTDPLKLGKFFLESTYNSNAIEGSTHERVKKRQMTIKGKP